MPSYDYECKSCGYRFEVFQSMSEEPLKTCPECGKSVRRLIGGGLGIIFKGSGFYVTDSKKSSSASTTSSSTATTTKNPPAKEKQEKSSSPSEAPSKEKAAV